MAIYYLFTLLAALLFLYYRQSRKEAKILHASLAQLQKDLFDRLQAVESLLVEEKLRPPREDRLLKDFKQLRDTLANLVRNQQWQVEVVQPPEGTSAKEREHHDVQL